MKYDSNNRTANNNSVVSQSMCFDWCQSDFYSELPNGTSYITNTRYFFSKKLIFEVVVDRITLIAILFIFISACLIETIFFLKI